MSGPIQTITLAGRRVHNALFPNQGPTELSVTVDFSYLASQGLHLTSPHENGEIDMIQTVWADNSSSGSTLFIKNDTNGQIIQYPPGSMGYQPFLCPNPPKVTVSCSDTTQTGTNIKFINVPVSAQMVYASVGGSSGTDESGNPPALGTLLQTMTVKKPGGYYVQNQSANDMQLVLDDGVGTPTITILSAVAAGSAGQDSTPSMQYFTGRIRLYGTAGSQFAARVW